jgi:hypothetical protein
MGVGVSRERETRRVVSRGAFDADSPSTVYVASVIWGSAGIGISVRRRLR